MARPSCCYVVGSGPHALARIGEIQRYGLRLIHANRVRYRRVTNVTLTGKWAGVGAGCATYSAHHSTCQKIKDADRQCYGDGDGLNRCEQTFSM